MTAKAKTRAKAQIAARKKKPRESAGMDKKTLIELQQIARSFGIPFGGMTRTQLSDKIMAYQ